MMRNFNDMKTRSFKFKFLVSQHLIRDVHEKKERKGKKKIL